MEGSEKEPPDRDGFVDRGTQTDESGIKRRKTVKLEIPRWLFWGGALLVGILSVYLSSDFFISFITPRFQLDPAQIEDMGVEGVKMFRVHDRDDDGYLSLDEFEPLAHRLLEVNETHEYAVQWQDGDEVVTFNVSFQPLLLETMTKDMDSLFTVGNLDSLHGLKYWKQPSDFWMNFAPSHMQPFLPPDLKMLEETGEVYYIIPPRKDELATLSSNRYVPPKLETDGEIIVHRILSVFHPRPFVQSRFAPTGSVAVVRGYNERFVDIVFRIHAEFQLNQPPFYPFWFTPAQFTGRLIISKDSSKLLFFHLYVPTDKKLNVDMEWLNGPLEKENMEVDIGFMPQMEIRTTRSSMPSFYAGKDIRDEYLHPTDDYEQSVKAIKWDKQIPLAEAARLLELKFYKFKTVPYYNMTEAFSRAKEEKKLVHSILLWGVLDDQSC